MSRDDQQQKLNKWQTYSDIIPNIIYDNTENIILYNTIHYNQSNVIIVLLYTYIRGYNRH